MSLDPDSRWNATVVQRRDDLFISRYFHTEQIHSFPLPPTDNIWALVVMIAGW